MQHRLRYALRGGEFAFAITSGDLGALKEIAGHCCDLWNGVNSLLIPVDEDGTVHMTDEFLGIREPERIYVHRGLSEKAQTAVRARWPDRAHQLWPRAFGHELHPLDLQPSYREPPAEGSRISLPVPRYDQPELATLARVIWGRIEDQDLAHYEEAFRLEHHDGDAAHQALVAGQTSRLSPLAQSAYLMRITTQVSPARARHVFVIRGGDFDELVWFWNMRARATTVVDQVPIVGVPAEALTNPESLRSLIEWTQQLWHIKPDVFVRAPADLEDTAAAAFDELGFRRAPEDRRLTEYFGEVPDDRKPLEYVLDPRPWIGGRMRRGVQGDSLINLEPGRNVVRFEPPEEFRTRTWGGYVRLDILSWPLLFPPSPATATRVHQDAFVDQGVVCLLTSASNRPLTFDLVLPGADDVLGDFLAAQGRTARLSAAGRYAQALIGRLGGPHRLDALARPGALAVLEPLTPVSRLKLVQRIDKMLTERYGEHAPPIDELGEMIRGLTELELHSRTLDDLASSTGRARDELLTALEDLVDVGFVRRGRQERCPGCGYDDFYPLAELDERVACHACHTTFLVRVASGGAEPRLAYQLDPLMARTMDQNLLPVLLTLRYLYSPVVASGGAFWPGLEIVDADGAMRECDVLLAQEESIIVCECKQSAPALSPDEADKTLALAELFDAVTYFAALDGDFSDEIQALARERGRIVLLTRRELLPTD